MPKIEAALKEYGMTSLEEARDLCLSKGIDVESIVKGVQPIAFENAVWAYTLGAAIALKKGITKAAEAAEAIGIGLQAFCVPGSVAENRKVGLGHGNLGASWQVTSPLQLLKVQSVSQEPPTKQENPRCASSSMVWARMQLTSSPESTALPMWKPNMTTLPAS